MILWLVLKINNSKYVCLCKCWHRCILKYCMKEDPNIIREGFTIDEGNDVGNVNGIPLLVAYRDEEVHRVEGHSIVITGSDDIVREYDVNIAQSKSVDVEYEREEYDGMSHNRRDTMLI